MTWHFLKNLWNFFTRRADRISLLLRKYALKYQGVSPLDLSVKIISTSYEFSEYLDLPEGFVVKAFAHYKAMGEI